MLSLLWKKFYRAVIPLPKAHSQEMYSPYALEMFLNKTDFTSSVLRYTALEVGSITKRNKISHFFCKLVLTKSVTQIPWVAVETCNTIILSCIFINTEDKKTYRSLLTTWELRSSGILHGIVW